MRIDGPSRNSPAGARNATARPGSGAAFIVDTGTGAARAASVGATAPAGGIEALIALQAVEDPLQAKKKVVRRARSLLDTLDAIKADLLTGRVGEERLSQLMMLVAQNRQRMEPGLERVLDDIELRVLVELAKFGRFPAR